MINLRECAKEQGGVIYIEQFKQFLEDVVERLENASHWTASTFDEDGYSNDDSEEVIYLQTAIAIVQDDGMTNSEKSLGE